MRGYEIAAVFRDKGSGISLERPGLQALIREANAGLIDAVLVRGLDRLTRNQLLFSQLDEMFRNADVRILSPFENADAFSQTTTILQALQAEMGRKSAVV